MGANPQSFPWLDSRLKGFSRPQRAGIVLLLIVGVAWLDHVTGFEYSMRIAYLLPIFLATWTIGRAAGVLAAVLCVTAWAFTGDHLFLHPLQFAWNSLVQLCVFLIFVTVLFRLRMALANADQRFVAVIEGLESAVYVLHEAEGALLYMNPKGVELFGSERPATVLDVERRFGVRPADLAASSKNGATRTFEAQDALTKKWYWLTVRPIRWVNGERVQLHIATDISERKRAEELAHERTEQDEVTARLVTAGEMASLLAHELSQPLAAITSYNTGCVRRLASGDWQVGELRDALEKSTAQAARAGSIIQGVREFLHKRTPDLVACDINGVIEEVAQTVRNETSRHAVRLRLDLDPGLPRVPADTIMLKQVLLNLIRNGLESMDHVPAEQRELNLRTRLTAEDTLQVDVADRGPGLAAELAANPFKPFFTTKPEGMGMGLQICRSIIELHGGRIWAAPNPAGGAVFHFTLGVTRP